VAVCNSFTVPATRIKSPQIRLAMMSLRVLTQLERTLEMSSHCSRSTVDE
jgi:hypothetical protein